MNIIGGRGVGLDSQRITLLFEIMESHLKGYETCTKNVPDEPFGIDFKLLPNLGYKGI